MITRITGKLVALGETAAQIEAGPFHYEVLIPEFVRRQLHAKLDEEVSLQTIEFLEGNPQQGRMVPRMIGFLSQAEREFFDLICSVDGVGVKKALRAMVRPVREVATAIEDQDPKQLSTLPGIGPAMADRIIAKLRRKMAKFALIVASDVPHEPKARDIASEAYEALIALGHSPANARQKLEVVMDGKTTYKSVEDLLTEIYKRERA
ncbi:MAG: helix-hairpin-helix domain-containing protein [Planctomycetaceae bacterium]|jgi:holliday junction DNA helicase RuvA|nr:helix-hairpin-helix domain-containing protein [Planctomycetaceae bacterium]